MSRYYACASEHLYVPCDCTLRVKPVYVAIYCCPRICLENHINLGVRAFVRTCALVNEAVGDARIMHWLCMCIRASPDVVVELVT